MRLAAIDCGTNTIRLLIGDYELTDQGIIINELERSGEIGAPRCGGRPHRPLK